VRTLKIDDKGFETVIGRFSGARAWKEVRSVELSDGAIVITGINNNAFVVPSRAFASERERLEFLEAARRFHTDPVSSGLRRALGSGLAVYRVAVVSAEGA
jgi:hypothetical protein